MISLIHLIIALIGLAAIAFGIVALYRIIGGYMSHPTGTFWERLRAGTKDSATKLGADLVMVGTAILSMLIYVPEIVGLPEFANAVREMLPAEVIPVVMLGIAILTHLTRNRSLK